MKTARYWHRRPDGWIECDLCPRHCRISDGGHGFCRVRERVGDELIAASYGLISGPAVDPIEKKPLYRFLPGSSVLSFGTVGCNLTCAFCQNAHLSRAEHLEGFEITPEEIAEEAVRRRCESVAFTYNEPAVFLEFAVDTARACHVRGIKTVAVTNGWIEPEPRKEFFAHMDAVNVDLKAFTDRFYKELCGATLEPVLETLVYIRNETDVHLEVTTLLIPGWNDSPAEVDAMIRWAVSNLGAEVPWHFSAYRPVPGWHDAPPTPLQSLISAKQIAEQNGLRYVYLGNTGIAA